MNKNNQIDQPILLITGDNKEDWFQKEIGLTIGPRPELIEEFKSVKNNLFFCYSTDKFLKHAEKYIGIKVEDNIVEEVGEHISKPRTSSETQSEISMQENLEDTTSIKFKDDNTGEITPNQNSSSNSINDCSTGI